MSWVYESSRQLGKLIVLVVAMVFLGFGPEFTPVVQAITAADLHSIRQNTPFYDPTQGWCNSSNGAILTGSDNMQKGFNFFVGKGLSPIQAAALIGNFAIESHMDPSITEGGQDTTTITPNKGYGIAQWTSGAGPNGSLTGRQAGLQKLAQQEAVPVNDLGMQLDYVWQELNGHYVSMFNQLKATTDLRFATVDLVMIHYEAPKDSDPNGPNAANRFSAAQQVLSLYGSGSQAGTTASTITSCGKVTGSGHCSSTTPSGYSAIKSALLSNKIDLEGDANADWAAQTYQTICTLMSAPAFYSKLTAAGTITVSLHTLDHCGGGHSGDNSADPFHDPYGIAMLGMCDPNFNRYLLTHELGHMYSFRNPAVMDLFTGAVWAQSPNGLPTYNCQYEYDYLGLKGPYRDECWADMIGEYDIYFVLRGTIQHCVTDNQCGPLPPGPADFKNYPTDYAPYYNFARDHIFGGVQFTTF